MAQEIYLTKIKENYINRTAIILKPLQPFLDWYSTIEPGYVDDSSEVNTYLISEDVDDVERWLKNRFDKLFSMELRDWYIDPKRWPKKRTYVMFRQWFEVSVSSMVYDLESEPVSKEI